MHIGHVPYMHKAREGKGDEENNLHGNIECCTRNAIDWLKPNNTNQSAIAPPTAASDGVSGTQYTLHRIKRARKVTAVQMRRGTNEHNERAQRWEKNSRHDKLCHCI